MRNTDRSFYFLFIGFALLGSATAVFAQDQVLPKGIGIYQLGHRDYSPQTEKFDSSGNAQSIGDRFNKTLDGRSLLKGEGGADLKRLATLLNDYSGQSTQNNLVDTLSLGRVEGSVEGQTKVDFLAIGYGLHDRLSLFVSIPYVRASTDTQLEMVGGNNAAYIRTQLGEAAFSEVQAGLAQASAISASQVKASIEAKGYAPLEHWSYDGVGDIRVGAVGDIKKGMIGTLKAEILGRSNLSIPTGYVEDPDVLTDVNIGKSYYSVEMTTIERIRHPTGLFASADQSYFTNFSSDRQMRVPESDEALPAAERKTGVRFQPGNDTEFGATTGITYQWIRSSYRFAAQRHYGDRYSGSLQGSYDTLSNGSDSSLVYQEFGIGFDSTGAYRAGTFAVPVIGQLKAHLPISGRNKLKQQYYEVTLASFFGRH